MTDKPVTLSYKGQGIEQPPIQRIQSISELKTALSWLNLLNTHFAGRVADDGTAISLPDGWTSAKTGTGQYKITHNLGHTDYGVAALALDANWTTISLSAINANDFRLITWNNTPTNTDRPFSFVLSMI